MTTTAHAISGTILNQMGGAGRLMAMIGANTFLNIENGLQFKFKGSRVANCVRITLDANDTYTVVFFKIKGFDCPEVDNIELVHACDLRRLFARVTGLTLTL